MCARKKETDAYFPEDLRVFGRMFEPDIFCAFCLYPGLLLLRPIGNVLTGSILKIIESLNVFKSLLAQVLIGGSLGVGMCYGSQVGAYHWLFLPLILLELETGKHTSNVHAR